MMILINLDHLINRLPSMSETVFPEWRSFSDLFFTFRFFLVVIFFFGLIFPLRLTYFHLKESCWVRLTTMALSTTTYTSKLCERKSFSRYINRVIITWNISENFIFHRFYMNSGSSLRSILCPMRCTFRVWYPIVQLTFLSNVIASDKFANSYINEYYK